MGTNMARGDTAIRLLKVVMYLETASEGLTVREIHERLRGDGIDVSERTVYRDLEVIGGAHFPVYSEGDDSDLENNRRWKFRRTTAISERVHFENHEIFALYLARESIKSLQGSPLMNDILKMTEKLEKILGPGVEKELKNLSGYVAYKATATWQTGVSQEVLDTIYQACWDNVVLELDYKSKSGTNANTVKQRRLGPETLYFANGGAYLIAKDLADNVIKSYSLNRVFSASYTEEAYQSSGFNLESFIKDNFGILNEGEVSDILIYVADPIGSFVSERRWHSSQQITRVEGGIHIKMRVKINDELARWILGLGPSAKVYEPQRLQSLVVELANQIVANNTGIKTAA